MDNNTEIKAKIDQAVEDICDLIHFSTFMVISFVATSASAKWIAFGIACVIAILRWRKVWRREREKRAQS